jgi:Family of unknown function (DUF6159)
MFSRFERSCRLIAASWDVLRSDRELLILPALSGVATALLAAVFFAPVVAAAALDPGHTGQAMRGPDALLYFWLFLFYVAQYSVVIFFNTALVGAALERLDGGDPTVASALALACRRLDAILGYAIISATVGVVLRAVSERFGLLGRLLGFGAGLAWTVMTFLVVPVLAAEGIGPLAAIDKSAALLRRSWGENLIGSAGISFVISLLMVVVMVVGFAGGIVSLKRGDTMLGIPLLAGSGVLLLAILLVGAALSAVYQAAVYYYAVADEPPRGFDRDLLRGAFGPKRGASS